METSYREWERKRREQETGRRAAPRRQKTVKAELGPREKRRLLQLVVCIVLFLAVFIGRGVMPDKMADLRLRLLETIQEDTDFRAVFAGLGRSISEGEPITETLGGLWTEVFGGGTVTVESSLALKSVKLYQEEMGYLNGYPQAQDPAAHWLRGLPEQTDLPGTASAETQPPAPEPSAEPQSDFPVVEHVAYSGPALPDNATMDRYDLGVLGIGETATPALGWVTSAFGWREHPVDGGEKFHNGVDLGVNIGTDVCAFAAGTVDYIGDSPIYGLYLQIRHAGGLTSFYAHCSALCVQQGQTVQAGEKVAESGDTGNATGPHLHFELKLNGTLLNPEYYIETT